MGKESYTKPETKKYDPVLIVGTPGSECSLYYSSLYYVSLYYVGLYYVGLYYEHS